MENQKPFGIGTVIAESGISASLLPLAICRILIRKGLLTQEEVVADLRAIGESAGMRDRTTIQVTLDALIRAISRKS